MYFNEVGLGAIQIKNKYYSILLEVNIRLISTNFISYIYIYIIHLLSFFGKKKHHISFIYFTYLKKDRREKKNAASLDLPFA